MSLLISSIVIVPLLRRIIPAYILEEAAYVEKHIRGKASFIWNASCYDSLGNIKWEELLVRNLLHDEGERDILQAAFSEAYSVPVSYFIGLDDRVTIAEGNALTNLAGEPAVGGYARQGVTSDATDWTITQDGGDYQAKSKTVTFTPSGADYPTVRNMFLCDIVSGTAGDLFASVALSQSRIVLDGDSLDTDITIKLSE